MAIKKMASLDDPINTTSGVPAYKRADMKSTIAETDTVNFQKTGLGGKVYTAFAKKGSPAAEQAASSGGAVGNLDYSGAKTEDTDPYASKNYLKSKSMSLNARDEENKKVAQHKKNVRNKRNR